MVETFRRPFGNNIMNSTAGADSLLGSIFFFFFFWSVSFSGGSTLPFPPVFPPHALRILCSPPAPNVRSLTKEP